MNSRCVRTGASLFSWNTTGGSCLLAVSNSPVSRDPILSVLLINWLSLQVVEATWTCTGPTCGRTVEFVGSGEAFFNMWRRNRRRQWLLFTRGVIDKLAEFIFTARMTYTAATRHLCAVVTAFGLRQHEVVKLDTAALRVFLIPAETERCPICGSSPKFVMLDAQAIGCPDPEDVFSQRLDMNCPVLDVPTAKLCVLTQPSLLAAV